VVRLQNAVLILLVILLEFLILIVLLILLVRAGCETPWNFQLNPKAPPPDDTNSERQQDVRAMTANV
jgi:hypothetical protein